MIIYLNMTFFLSGQHWVTINGVKGDIHTHIWEIGLKISGEMFRRPELEVGFTEVETIIRNYLAQFEGKVLNNIKPFDMYSASTENLGVYFSYGLKEILKGHGFELEELTIRESPTRGVTISNLNNQREKVLEGTEPNDNHPAAPFGWWEDFQTGAPAAVVKEMEKAAEEAAAAREDTVATEESAVKGANEVERAKVVNSPDNVDRSDEMDYQNDTSDSQGLVLALIFLLFANILIYSPVLFSASPFPWGVDTWGHLYKSEFLYRAFQEGYFYPRYMSEWYNGIDPFRYYAPLPYYILTMLRFITGDIFRALTVFLLILSFFSSSSWLFFRKRIGLTTTVFLAVLWALAPYNLRVAFMEGNLPWFFALAFLPVLLYLVLQIQSGKNSGYYYTGLIIVLNIIILSHAMVGAVFLVSISLYLLLLFVFGGIELGRLVKVILTFCAAVMISGWWLLPSLMGGITTISKEAVVEALAYPSPLESLNPLLRFSNPETYYFGLGYLILAAVALRRWQYREPYQKAAIVSGLGIFLLTTPLAEPFYGNMPLSHLLWPVRFVPVGIAFLLLGCLESFNIKEFLSFKNRFKIGLVSVLAIILLSDSLISMVWVRAREYPDSFEKMAAANLGSKGYKVAVLDQGKLGSIPTYLLSEKFGFGQIYGWAYQGAATNQNVMLLNLALEKECYVFLFDRLIEMGATHVIVLDELVKERPKFDETASENGYEYRGKWDSLSVYSKEIGPYLVAADYKVLGIGRHVSNMALMFPEVEIGSSTKIDDYTLKELSQYETVYLSGFNWESKIQAEDLILAYADQGGRVVVDLTGAPRDVLSTRVSFLGVVAEPVIIGDTPLISVGDEDIRLTSLPQEYVPWKTFVLEGVDEVSSLINYYDQKKPIEGYKVFRNQNIYYVGMNLPFYGFLTGDQAVIKMMERLLNVEKGGTLARGIIEVELADSRDWHELSNFRVPAEFAGRRLVLPIAYLDGMQIELTGTGSGEVQTSHKLVQFSGSEGEYEMRIKVHWPSQTKPGVLVSLAGLLIYLGLLGKPLLKIGRSLRWNKVWLLVPFLTVLSFTAIFTQVAEASNKIIMDGQFSEWEHHPYLDDPLGDIINVSDQTVTAGDTRRLYWGTNANDENLYFSIIRYSSEVKDDWKHKMTGKIFFDINNNGRYDDESIDRAGYFQYNPSSGKVRIKVYKREQQSSSPLWETIGDFGDRKGDGLQFELYFPFEALGISPGQPIRFYAVTSFIKNDNPKTDDDWVLDPDFDDFDLYKHDFDLIPDVGDIQYTPIPTMGYFLFAVFLIIAIGGGVLIIRKGKMYRHGTGH